MRLAHLKSSAVGMLSASIASLCCLLPLTVVVLGLGSGAFMAVTMRYSYVFIPAGIVGTGVGYYLYVRERKRCARLRCAMAGSRVNLGLLALSTLVLGTAVALTAWPDYGARVIASWGGRPAVEDGRTGTAGSGPAVGPTGEAVPAGPRGAMVAGTRATLQVEGMT